MNPQTGEQRASNQAKRCTFFALAILSLLSVSLRAESAGSKSSNARLYITAITEMTEPGRKNLASTKAPVTYFIPKSQGVLNRGDAMKESAATEEQVEAALVGALKSVGFAKATDANPAQVAIFYMWGSHFGYDPDTSGADENQHTRNILDRAALVGGRQFAADLAKAYRDTEMIGLASPHVNAERAAPFTDAPVGIALGMSQMNTAMSPLRLFSMRSAKHEQLLTQTSRDCYYVVVTAYDIASVGKKGAPFLWRTRMTVSASGTSQVEALPHMISVAAPHFARDMKEAEIIVSRAGGR